MLNTALVVAVLGGAAGQAYPDELDILRGADTTPQIELVLDTSGSMQWDTSPDARRATVCSHYYQNVADLNHRIPRSPSDPAQLLYPFEMLNAALTGCQTPTDGVLDQWANRVMFAVREFGGSRTGLLQDFDPTMSNLPALEAAVLSITPGGSTPMAQAYAQAAQHISGFFNDANSAQCRQNYIVLMTDGDGNGPSATVAVGQGNAPINFNDLVFGGTLSDRAAQHMAWQDADPFSYVDSLPNVTGVQPIRTFTISFGAQPPSAISLLQSIAGSGDGQYYAATSYQQLSDAFTQIVLSIVARSNVAFSPGTIQNDGLFAGNYTYVTSFAPYEAGPWHGTTKKYCVFPTGPSDTDCLFLDLGNDTLVTNTQPLDIWSGTRSTAANVGGTGERIWTNLLGVTGPGDPPPSNPLGRRTILTWIPGQNGYVRVDGTNLSNADTWTTNPCRHHALINRLHGYTEEVADCAGGVYDPVAVAAWPLGDTVHGDTVLIKYTQNCEVGGDSCFVATVANDGMLHFYDAVTGVETSALVPGHLWSPNQVATHQLRDFMNQPNLSEMRRYFFDGGVRLYHDDRDADGIVDSGETAKLIAGLGRGGRSYIAWDMSTFNGVPTSAANPPEELMVDEASSLRNLRETWAAPWIGRHRHTDGNLYDVAVFPSGHDRELDRPTAPMATVQAGLPPPTLDTRTTPQNLGCPAFGLPSALCSPPFPSSCVPCNDPTAATCPPLVFGQLYCYDWPGYIGNPAAAPFNASGGPGVGHDLILGPFSWSNSNYEAVAYRVVFSHFDLQPNDYIAVLDSNQNEVDRLTGNSARLELDWVNDRSFYLRFVTDGDDSDPSSGFSVQRISFIRRPTVAPSPTTWRHSIYVMDLDRWNGPSGAPSRRFAARPGAGDARQEAGVLARITSDCEGLQTAGQVCLDATGSGGQPAQPDLQYMVCPISAEPSVLTEGGLFSAVYWGDECGQIFRASRDAQGNWSARRLLRTNNEGSGGFVVSNEQSPDYRKIFTRLELVLSTCNGGRAVGVYFGTGNVQTAGSYGDLADPTVSRFTGQERTSVGTISPDVVGVVWDHPSLPDNLGLDGLANITSQVQVNDPRSGSARDGWIIELAIGSKMVRDPLVFDGVAYFKTFSLIQPATECVSATSVEATLAMDSCTGRPIADGNLNGTVADDASDRYIAASSADIGADLTLFTPRDRDAFVSDPTSRAQISARLQGRPNRRLTRFQMWRTQLD